MGPSVFFLNRDAETVDFIRHGDRQGLLRVYDDCRQMVVSHVTRNSGTRADADDVLEEAVVVLWERIRSGRFELQSRLSTFVVATAQNIWLRSLSRRRREIPMEIDPDTSVWDDPSPSEANQEEERSEAMSAAFRRLGHPCRTLLVLFYWERLSMDDIARQLGFANASTAKAKKYQCKEQLRRLMAEAAT